MENVINGIAWIIHLGRLAFRLCLFLAFCLWLLGSSHAGHLLGWNDFGAFASSSIEWITKGWRH
jgi:hypothetical protein